MNVDKNSYLFKIVFYHVSNICNEIFNQDDETSEKHGTEIAKSILEFTHTMGSFESIIENLDALTCKIVENAPIDILEEYDEVLYDYAYTNFLTYFSK